jgi:hypothetical protein
MLPPPQMQPSISSYFKQSKKRPRDDPTAGDPKLSKLSDAKQPATTSSDPPTCSSPTKEKQHVPFVHSSPLSPQKTKKRRVQLSKEDVQRLIESKGKLKDLQKALESISGAKQQLDAFRKIAASSVASSSVVASSAPSPKKGDAPAYQR